MTGRGWSLILLAASLGAVIAWEIAASRDDVPAAPPPSRTTSPNLPATPPVMPTGVERSAGWVATTLARPLFRPDRRPPAATPSGPAPAEEALPRLTGIMVSGDGRSAIFAGSPQPIVLREGGRLGGFTVHLIESGQVTLLGPDGLREVRPSFDPNKTTPTAQPSPQPLPGALPSPPGANPGLRDPANDAIPFGQKPAPSGLDIIRNQAGRAPGIEAPAR